MNDKKIEQVKRLIWKEILQEDEENFTSEFRTQVEKAIFKIESIILS